MTMREFQAIERADIEQIEGAYIEWEFTYCPGSKPGWEDPGEAPYADFESAALVIENGRTDVRIDMTPHVSTSDIETMKNHVLHNGGIGEYR